PCGDRRIRRSADRSHPGFRARAWAARRPGHGTARPRPLHSKCARGHRRGASREDLAGQGSAPPRHRDRRAASRRPPRRRPRYCGEVPHAGSHDDRSEEGEHMSDRDSGPGFFGVIEALLAIVGALTVMGVVAVAASVPAWHMELRRGEQGKTFGSVTAKEVAEALKKEAKAEIDKTNVVLHEPLRSLGIHKVEVRLLTDVRADVTVAIEPA